jgi:hypothetical protein
MQSFSLSRITLRCISRCDRSVRGRAKESSTAHRGFRDGGRFLGLPVAKVREEHRGLGESLRRVVLEMRWPETIGSVKDGHTRGYSRETGKAIESAMQVGLLRVYAKQNTALAFRESDVGHAGDGKSVTLAEIN